MKSKMLTPLRLPPFRRVWAGQALSGIGNGVLPVALAAAILGHHPSADLGFVLGAESLMLVLVALLGGVLADRMRRTRAMIIADLLQLSAVTGFAVGAARAPLVVAIGLAMLAGLGAGLFRPASQALMPTLAPSLLIEANALQSLTSRVGLIVGPGLGGLLLVLAGSSAAFWFDAATFLVSVISLAGIRDAKPGREREEGIIAEARAGIRAVLARPWVATIIGQGTAQLLFAMAPALVLLPIYLRAHGHMSAYGVLLSLQAAGSVTGGLLVGLRPPRKPGTVGVLGLGLLGFQLLCMAAGAPLPLLGAAIFLTGLGYALFGVLWASGLQRSIPGELLGRVFAVEMLGTYALEPVGLAIAPVIAVVIGLRDILITAVIMMVVTTVIPLLVPGVREFADPVVHGAKCTEPVNQP